MKYNGAEERQKKFIIAFSIVAVFIIVILKLIFSSNWISSSDFHSVIEIIGSFVAIFAGITSLIYYFGLNNRYYLIVGLGFFISGSEDLIHGILSFERLFQGMDVDFSRFIPGTYVAGRCVLALMTMLAPVMEKKHIKSNNQKREATILSFAAFCLGACATALALVLPLPQFIFPDKIITRPFDFFVAILFAIALLILAKRFKSEKDTFTGMLIISLLFNLGSEVYMSFSKQLHDVFFDVAHIYNVIGYLMPLLGIALQGLEEMKKANFELINRKKADKIVKKQYNEIIRYNEELKYKNDEIWRASELLSNKTYELRDSEEKFRAIYETAAIGIAQVSPDNLYFNSVNKAFCEFIGYCELELLKLKLIDIVHPEERQQSKNEISGLLKNKYNNFVREKRYIHKNTSSVWGKIVVSLVRSKDGKPLNLVVIISDITQMKSTEKELIISEKRYKSFVENAMVGIFRTTFSGEILFANNALLRLLNFDSEYDFKSESVVLRYKRPEDREKFLADIWRIGKVENYEIQMLDKHGEIKTVLLSASIYEENLSGLIIDITDRKKTEESLKKSEQTNYALLNSIPDMLFHFDKNGLFLNYKSSTDDYLYMPSDFFIGKNVTEVFPSEFAERVIQAIGETMLLGEYKYEYQMPVKDVIIDFEARFASISESEVLVLVRNVSEQKKYEKELKISKNKAEQASVAKSEFLASMSHEIRTPLNAILGFSEIMLSDSISTQHAKYLEAILSSGKTLLSLINDILDLSKIEAGRLELVKDSVNLHNVFLEIEQMFSHKTHEKNLSFQIVYGKQIPEAILLDEIRIRQVIFNLVGNALKFTEKGYVKLSASVRFEENTDKMQLILMVEDSGIGIGKDQQKRIFNAFMQQSGQDSKKYGGTGLGLAITKKLVEKMNGKISLKSKLGKGSLFKVVLDDVKITTKLEVKNKEFSIENKIVTFEPATVMIVDDLQLNIEAMKRFLSDMNLRLLEANSGEVALEVLKNKIPDLIFMDIRMIGIGGIETAKRVLQTPELQHIPIIAFTASAKKSDKDSIKLFFDGILRKPATRIQIIQKLMQFLPHTVSAKSTNFKANKDTFLDSIEIENNDLLADLLHEIEQKSMPVWEKIKNDLVLFEIDDFANELLEIAEKYNQPYLIEYCNKLINSIESVDILNIEKLLSNFLFIFIQIKKNV